MTNKEKQLLLQDLCSRLPYGVKINHQGYIQELTVIVLEDIIYSGHEVKPYLRPMESMTEKEREVYHLTMRKYTHRLYPNSCDWSDHTEYCWTIVTFNWLNAHHFDYRGLIPMGLALEAHEGMYN